MEIAKLAHHPRLLDQRKLLPQRAQQVASFIPCLLSCGICGKAHIYILTSLGGRGAKLIEPLSSTEPPPMLSTTRSLHATLRRTASGCAALSAFAMSVHNTTAPAQHGWQAWFYQAAPSPHSLFLCMEIASARCSRAEYSRNRCCLKFACTAHFLSRCMYVVAA